LTFGQVYGVGAWRSVPVLDRRRFGVPPGGPWDQEASAYVRAIAGLEKDADVFELLQGSCELYFQKDGAVAVAGVGTRLDGENFCGIRRVSRGKKLVFAAHVGYLAFISNSLGGANLGWTLEQPDGIRFLPELFENSMTVRTTRAFSRSGVRFESEISFSAGERPSEPSCVGAIQLTPSGEIIVIGPDGPTIGGYPRLGTVIAADLDLIPRLNIGQSLEFHPVTLEVALDLAHTRRQLLESRCAFLKASARASLG